MATKVHYLPLQKDLKDSDGNQWLSKNVVFSSYNDGTREFNGVKLTNRISWLKSGKTSSSIGNYDVVTKWWMAGVPFQGGSQSNDLLWCSSRNWIGQNKIQVFNINRGATVVAYGPNNIPFTFKSNKWYYCCMIYNHSNNTITLKVDGQTIKTQATGCNDFMTFESIGEPTDVSANMIGYVAHVSQWYGDLDETHDYKYEDLEFESRLKILSTLTGVYDKSPNGLKYCYRVLFEKSGNVVNYETCQKLRLLMYLYKILIISIFLKTLKIRVVS